MMHAKKEKKLPREGIGKILIRGTNWVGDAVLTLGAVSAVKETYREARIYVLAKPWVADIYRLCPGVDEVIIYESPGAHEGVTGKALLARRLKSMKFDAAILLQNAMEAAVIARLAGIPIRAGYNSDARGFLLTHAVGRTKALRKLHQAEYYLAMAGALGCAEARRGPFLSLDRGDEENARRFLENRGLDAERLIVGMAPGAVYGPAKKWLPGRFAELAERLKEKHSAQIVLFGSRGDREATAEVGRRARYPLLDLAGATDLRTAVSLIARCRLFISNDSGLMHVAGGLNIPVIAIFGSTDPAATAPTGDKKIVVYRGVDCSPCLRKTCPGDFRCMDLVTTDEVYEAARSFL